MKLVEKNIWLTSDTHWGHAGICRGATHWRSADENGDKQIPLDAVRDFDTVDDMNEAIVENINDCVKENDTLFHLGDWSFDGFESIEEFRRKINCKNIHLILGNHDHHIKNNKRNIRSLFSSVDNYQELMWGSNKKNKKLMLFHYPIISWEHMGRGAYMLHGHQHLKGDLRFGDGRRMDVGIDGNPEFRPYHIDEIIGIFKDKGETPA